MTRVRDLFVVLLRPQPRTEPAHPFLGDDAINFVSRTAKNNGVSARVERIRGMSRAGARTLLRWLSRARPSKRSSSPLPSTRSQNISDPHSNPGDDPSTRRLYWVASIRSEHFRYGLVARRTSPSADLELPDALPDWCSGDRPRLHRPARGGLRTIHRTSSRALLATLPLRRPVRLRARRAGHQSENSSRERRPTSARVSAETASSPSGTCRFATRRDPSPFPTTATVSARPSTNRVRSSRPMT